jgi:hypothetical protein
MKQLVKKVSFPIAALLIISLGACNNEKNKTDDKPAVSSEQEQKPAAAAAFNGNFPYLTLNMTDLDAFFTPANIQKVVFRFQFDDGNSAPSLVAYKATSVRVYNTTPLTPRLTKTGLSRNLTGELFLGNLEMSRKQYTDLKAASGGASLVIFAAKKDGLNVTYELATGSEFNAQTLSTLKFLAGSDLNPSPPKNPGGTD